MESIRYIAQNLRLLLPQCQQPASEPITITLVAISEDAPLSQFAASLTEAFAKLGSTKRIHLSLFRQSQNCSFAAHDDQQWIDVQTSGRRFVVFQTHPQAQAWTELGVQRADVVLLIGKFGANPAPGRLERLLQHLLADQPKTRVELALLSDGETTQLTSAAAWLSERRVDNHHYVNLNGRQDFDRLARSFSQKDIEVARNSADWRCEMDCFARVYA